MPQRFGAGGFMSCRIVESMGVIGLIVGGEVFVEPSFAFIETPGAILLRGEQLAHLYEGTHDVDTLCAGARGVQDIDGLDAWAAP
jgi:hypothetical protein